MVDVVLERQKCFSIKSAFVARALGAAYTLGRSKCRVDTGSDNSRSRSDFRSQISLGMQHHMSR
jgi:hypothetical protein